MVAMAKLYNICLESTLAWGTSYISTLDKSSALQICLSKNWQKEADRKGLTKRGRQKEADTKGWTERGGQKEADRKRQMERDGQKEADRKRRTEGGGKKEVLTNGWKPYNRALLLGYEQRLVQYSWVVLNLVASYESQAVHDTKYESKYSSRRLQFERKGVAQKFKMSVRVPKSCCGGGVYGNHLV